MTKPATSLLTILLFAVLLATPLAKAAQSAAATSLQSDCSALNRLNGEGKFTGQISNAPYGNTMQVSYGNQAVVVRYTSSVLVCQGGQPASVDALVRGASVSVFGPMRRNGNSVEIDAARIFVAGPPRTARFTPARPAGGFTSETQTPARSGEINENPPAAQPDSRSAMGTSGMGQAPAGGMRGLNSVAVAQRAILNSVMLRDTYPETMQRLHVVRKYALDDVRSRPQLTVGQARLDLTPMLRNDKALFNIAQRLHAMPQHVEVKEDSSEISEVDEGLVIHHTLTYRILPGNCADGNAKAQLAGAGVGCFERGATMERLAEFSRPGAARYVADPGKRQAAAATYQRNIAASTADANQGIANLRKALANPNQRAAISAQVGEAEAARMSSMSDDQLKEELINSSVQHYEETLFVPKVESSNYAHLQHLVMATGSAAEADAVQRMLHDGVNGSGPSNFPKLLKVVPGNSLHLNPSAAPTGDQAADLELGPYYFLTGFTIGHDYEWNWGATITINWCVVGCSSTYGVQLNAGFNYAFGLRFPIQAQFKYHTVVHPNNSFEADLSGTFEPIEGNVDDFFEAGIPAEQLYNAKEIVAQVGANAGFNISLPGLGVGDSFGAGVDFTNYLPSPYTGGRFQPPAPGSGGINSDYTFNQIDLLGGLLNYGVVGGQLFPSIRVNLHSDKLQFTLNDEVQRRQMVLGSPPRPVSLGTTRSGNGVLSHFSIGNPVYNLGFTVTPGLTPNVFVDIDIWSDNWNWTIWFPQLAVDLPPNGIDFGCHAGTTCVVDFEPVFNPSTGQIGDTSRERDAADRTLVGGGCQRVNGQEGNYLCPVKGMLGLCKTMMSNNAVSSCGALVPTVVDQILTRGKCTRNDGEYSCPQGMMGLCNLYVKNQEIVSCRQVK